MTFVFNHKKEPVLELIWTLFLRVSPSTISSESSRKNSLSGGLLGRLSVFNSCWILVDTLLLTGTPGQTPRASTVINICKQATRRNTAPPHMQLYSNTNLYCITHPQTGRTLRTSTQSGPESAAGRIRKGKFVLEETQIGQ